MQRMVSNVPYIVASAGSASSMVGRLFGNPEIAKDATKLARTSRVPRNSDRRRKWKNGCDTNGREMCGRRDVAGMGMGLMLQLGFRDPTRCCTSWVHLTVAGRKRLGHPTQAARSPQT